MSADLIFSICNTLVLPAWALLIFLPRWKWTLAIICSGIVPFFLALVYLGLLLSQVGNLGEGGSFNSLEGVMILFANPYAMAAGWVHYLAFDLLIGSWEVRDSQKLDIPHWQVIPCLILTFVLGPVGLGLYFILRSVSKKQILVYAD